ncbi:MAG: hypothetical protein ABGY75_00320 [Gemmataceae bacterium]
MTRVLFAAMAVTVGGAAFAADKGTAVTVGSLKGTTPADWKEETPSNRLRTAQFKLEKEKGDAEDAEVAVFVSPGGGGIDANLKRQENTFKVPEGVKKEDANKLEDVTVGGYKGKYQALKGTYQFKAAPFDPNSKVTEKEKFRQLYVVFEDDNQQTISIRMVGPEKTVEKHKKGFEEFIKSFKK